MFLVRLRPLGQRGARLLRRQIRMLVRSRLFFKRGFWSIKSQALVCWKPHSFNFCQTVCTRSENTSEPHPNHVRTTSEPHPNHIRRASEPHLKQWQKLTGEIQKGTGGRGRDRKCHKLSWRLSQIVVTFYDDLWRLMTFYDVLCQWNKETEIVTKCRKLSWPCRKLSWRLSQIVVTFFFPSPSRRPLLVFAELREKCSPARASPIETCNCAHWASAPLWPSTLQSQATCIHSEAVSSTLVVKSPDPLCSQKFPLIFLKCPLIRVLLEGGLLERVFSDPKLMSNWPHLVGDILQNMLEMAPAWTTLFANAQMVAFAERVGGFARVARNGTSMAVALARTNCRCHCHLETPFPKPPF